MSDNIASQAQYYNNFRLIKRDVKSVVHLEDIEDKMFWNHILQRYRPGTYHFLYYSKSEKGNNTRGCSQCLKFLPYLTPDFFICIDSDFRHLMGEPNHDAAHYVIQTYTYSWENHFCEQVSLQAAITDNTAGLGFNFSVFLQNLSQSLYEPLLLLLFCKRIGSNYLTEKTFRIKFKKQCTAAELQYNGRGYVTYIKNQFKNLLDGASSVGFDLNAEAASFKLRGLDPGNAYLHVRGHNLYDLVSCIGKICFKNLGIRFNEDVLNKTPLGGSYWEYTNIAKDLGCF